MALMGNLMGNLNLLLVAHYLIWFNVNAHVIVACNLISVLNNIFGFSQNNIGQWIFDMFKVLLCMNVEPIY